MESDYTPSKEHDMSNHDAAAVEALVSAMARDDMNQRCMAVEILAAIRDGKVPTIYHISHIPGIREFESRYDKDQKELADLLTRCEAAEKERDQIKTESVMIAEKDGILSRCFLRICDEVKQERDTANARVVGLERERETVWNIMCEGGKIVRCSDIVIQAKGIELYIQSLEAQRDAYMAKTERNKEGIKRLASALKTLIDCIEDSTFQDGIFMEAKYEQTTVCTSGDLDEAKAALKEVIE